MSWRSLTRWLSVRRLALALGVLCGLALVTPQAWAWYQFRTAKKALNRYHPDDALESLSACERVWGSRASVHLLASRAARQSGDYEMALRELRESQRLSGPTDETAFEWALLQAASGNVLEVEDFLQKQLKENPEVSPLAWEALAEGYLKVYRAPDAMACITHWLEFDKDNIRALELRGMTYVTGRGVVYGSNDFRTVLSLDPTRKDTRWRLVNCLLSLGVFEEAAEHLEWLQRQSPDDPEIAARLARCYLMLKRGDDGRRLLENALQKHPENGLCLRTLGQFMLAEGRLADAEAVLTKAVAAWPEDYQTNWLLFQAFQQQGKEAERKAQLARAEGLKDRNERLSELSSRKLAEQPLDPGLHFEMGTLLMRSGREDVALLWFQSALALDPNHRPTHTALADYYDRIGDKAKATEHRQKAGDLGRGPQ